MIDMTVGDEHLVNLRDQTTPVPEQVNAWFTGIYQEMSSGKKKNGTRKIMAIHTFGEYLDFHPHLHALVADGLFTRSGMFHVMPELSLAPLEELFRARVISFLVKKELLLPERARMLLGWRHSGFNQSQDQAQFPGL
jgi:hypothetical protein